MDLFLSTPGAITAAVHLLEDSAQSKSFVGKWETAALLRALTALINRSTSTATSSTAGSSASHCHVGGVAAVAGAAAGMSSPAAASLAGDNSVAARLAKIPTLLPMLLELMGKRVNTGDGSLLRTSTALLSAWYQRSCTHAFHALKLSQA